MRVQIRGGARRLVMLRNGVVPSGVIETARFTIGDAVFAEVMPGVSGTSAPTEAAPVVITQPVIPAGAAGATVTLSYGAASGLPMPTATATLTRDGSPVVIPSNRQIVLATGTYILTVTWSNGIGTPAVATTTRTVGAATTDATEWADETTWSDTTIWSA